MRRVVVVGSGFSGLAAARTIIAQAEEQVEVIVLESGDCAGGRARTRQLPSGAPIELGATWLHGIESNPLYDLAVWQGLVTDLRGDPSIEKHDIDWQLHFAKPCKRGDSADFLSGRLREVALQAVYKFTAAAEECQESNDLDPTTSVGGVLRAHFDEAVASLELTGQELDVFAESWCSREKLQRTFDGFFSTDDVSLAFPRELEVLEGPNLPMPGGWVALINNLCVGLDIRYGRRVSMVEYGSGGVVVTCCDGEVFDCDSVIMTVSVGVLQANHTHIFQPPLPEWKQSALTAVRIGVADKIFAEFEIEERPSTQAADVAGTKAPADGCSPWDGTSSYRLGPGGNMSAPQPAAHIQLTRAYDLTPGHAKTSASALASPPGFLPASPSTGSASAGGQHSERGRPGADQSAYNRNFSLAVEEPSEVSSYRSLTAPSSTSLSHLQLEDSRSSGDSSEISQRKRQSESQLSGDDTGGGQPGTSLMASKLTERAKRLSDSAVIATSLSGVMFGEQQGVCANQFTPNCITIEEERSLKAMSDGTTNTSRGVGEEPESDAEGDLRMGLPEQKQATASNVAANKRRKRKNAEVQVVDSYAFMWPISNAHNTGSLGLQASHDALPGGVELSHLPDFAAAAGVPKWCLGLHSVRFNPGPCWVCPNPVAHAPATQTPESTQGTCAVFWITGAAALEMEKLSDEEVSRGITSLLHTFPQIPIPPGAKLPPRIVRTKWGTDPDFLGSYSYSRSGVCDGTAVDLLAEPVCDKEGWPLVMFAGEATHRQHMGTAHGAFLSGCREANRLIEAMEDLEVVEDADADSWTPEI